MNDAKIQFSADELHLVINEEIILTKNRIVEKVCGFFGLLANNYRMLPVPGISSTELPKHPKIARGENYKGLPYVMLDFPRYFTKDDIFAIRSMFWWGNDFSITLHLKGYYKTLFENTLIKNAALFEQPGWYIQASGNEWQHHYSTDTHHPIAGIAIPGMLDVFEKSDFIKIAFYFPLQKWNEADQMFLNLYSNIINALDQLPNR